MKRLIPFLMIALSGCATGRYYDYTFRLNGENVSDTLTYESQSLRIAFKPHASNIAFTMLNKSGNDLKILWDDAVIVVADTSNKAIHGDVRLLFDGNPQVPNIVIAGSYFKDLVCVTRVSSLSGTAKSPNALVAAPTTTYYMLPNYDAQSKVIANKILGMKGKHVKLYLPIQAGGNATRYIFDFEILNVKARKIISHA